MYKTTIKSSIINIHCYIITNYSKCKDVVYILKYDSLFLITYTEKSITFCVLCGNKLIRGKKYIICHATHCKDKKGPRLKIPLDFTPHNIDGMFQERMIYCYTCGEELYKDDTIIMCIDGCESLVTFNDLERQEKLTIPDKSLTPTSHESEAKAETSFRTKVNETSLTKPKRSSTTDTMVPLAPPATMQKPKPKYPPRKMLEESSKVQAAAEPPAKPKTKPEHPPRKKLEESSKVQAAAEPPAKPKTKPEQRRAKTSETDIKHAGKTKPTQSSVDKEKTKQNIHPTDKILSRQKKCLLEHLFKAMILV